MKEFLPVQQLGIRHSEIVIGVAIVVEGADEILVHHIHEIAVDVHVLVHHTHQLAEAFILYSLGIAGLDVLKIFFRVLLVGIITQAFDQVHRQERNSFRRAVDVVEDEGEILQYEILSCLVGIEVLDVDLEFIIGFVREIGKIVPIVLLLFTHDLAPEEQALVHFGTDHHAVVHQPAFQLDEQRFIIVERRNGDPVEAVSHITYHQRVFTEIIEVEGKVPRTVGCLSHARTGEVYRSVTYRFLGMPVDDLTGKGKRLTQDGG